MTEALASSSHTPVRSVRNDFLDNFTVIVDRFGGKMTFVKD